jgi:hypothetical protein
MADIEVQAKQVSTGVDTEVSLAQHNESCYNSEAIRGNVV